MPTFVPHDKRRSRVTDGERRSRTCRSGGARKRGGGGGRFIWGNPQQDVDDALRSFRSGRGVVAATARAHTDVDDPAEPALRPALPRLARQRSCPADPTLRWNPHVAIKRAPAIAAAIAAPERPAPAVAQPALKRLSSHESGDLGSSAALFLRLGRLSGGSAPASAPAAAALADAEWGSIDPMLLEQMTDRRIEATTGLATAGHRYAGQHKQATAAAATAPAEAAVDADADAAPAAAADAAAPAAVDSDADAAPAALTASSSGGACAKRVMRELRRELPKSLDLGSRGSMFLRFDDEQLQYMRVLITGVEGTPYANGVFLFDVFCPADYPNVHPLVTHVTPGATTIKGKHTPGGFSPNLHADSGKVCLSLLGTWAGLGWKPGKSNIYQVLSSIQWMILAAEEPYYMEPGNGGWEGTAPPPGDARTKQPQVVWYRELVEYATMKIAILRPLEYCAAAAGAGEGVAAATEPEKEKSKSSTAAASENAIFGAFLPVLLAHFRSKRKSILATLHGWIARDGTTKEHRARLEELVPQLQAAFGRLMGRGAAAADLNVAQQQVEHVLATMQALDVLREAAAKLGAPRAPAPRAPAAPDVQALLALQRELHEAEQSLTAVARPDPPTPPSSPALSADAGACVEAGAGGGGGSEDEDEDEVDDSPFGATEQHEEQNDY